MFNTKLNKPVDFAVELALPCSERPGTSVAYRLTGLVVHFGSSVHSGHYVAFVQVQTSPPRL